MSAEPRRRNPPPNSTAGETALAAIVHHRVRKLYEPMVRRGLPATRADAVFHARHPQGAALEKVAMTARDIVNIPGQDSATSALVSTHRDRS